ncbi:MAG: IS66 family transposase [Leptospirillia bacterium]
MGNGTIPFIPETDELLSLYFNKLLESSRLLSDRLDPFMEHVRTLLISAPVLHAGETGLRSEATLRWCHVASTSRVTLLGLHEKRGKEGIEALGVVNRAKGTAVHDFGGPYLSYPGQHSFCNAHLLRELTAIEEFDHHRWATEMKAFLVEAKACAFARKGPPGEREGMALKARRQDILARGWSEAERPEKSSSRGRKKATPAQNLLPRFEEYSRQILAFFFDPAIPFTNDQAKQDLRMVKVRQKVSGGFRTDRGARIFFTIRSYTGTLRKQGHDVWSGLTRSMKGLPFLPSDA